MKNETYEYFGLKWQHGDKFHFRTWLALKLLNPELAKTYFRTTV